MEKLASCTRCGVVATRLAGQPGFCCLGCALVGRVPVDPAGNFPVNRWLVLGLVILFFYFNQLLFWTAVIWKSHHGAVTVSGVLIATEVGAAFLVWASQVFAIATARVLTAKDFLFAALALALLISSWRTSPPSFATLAAANLVFLVWNGRGLLRRESVVAPGTGG